jgi:tetratricopeptide (TPR) repeat protein
LQRQSTIATWCERVIEGGWLFALIFIPSYFNLLSARHFEPDKATSLRSIVLVMLAAALIRWLDQLNQNNTSSVSPGASSSFWQRLRRFPMALPVIGYVVVFLFATIISIAPWVSFWGSYQRLQGTYTNLSYIFLGGMIALNLRTREQLDRLIGALALGSIPVAGYGWIQHYQIDPLPWRGDVIARVASTMGNSIFVAAYMIMVLPLALARGVIAIQDARHAAKNVADSRNRGLPAAWGAAYLLIILGAVMIGLSALMFGAVVRTEDLRYWWVYPGSLVALFALFLIPTLRPHTGTSSGVVWSVVVSLGYVLLVGLLFLAGQGSGQQVVPITGRPGVEWPFFMVGGIAIALVGISLTFVLPKLGTQPNPTLLAAQSIGMFAISIFLLVAIVFTQSRGPWIGGFAGLVVFGFALLIIAIGYARQQNHRSLTWLRITLAGVSIFTVSVTAFVIAFNLLNIPQFEELRKVPYIGRMGRLLEINDGTGLVRKLIWVGDNQAGGAIALISSNPLRALVGWGPETMFVAYNPFYPPELAYIESRGASPDRSHMAYLDELINKGLLGLLSYLAVIVSFFALCIRLIRYAGQKQSFTTQILLIGCAATIIAHIVEISVGIPIVATLMLQAMTIGTTVAIGRLIGAYEPEPHPEAVSEPTEPAPAQPELPPQRARGSGRSQQRQNSGRGTARGAGRVPVASRKTALSPIALLIYGLVFGFALLGAWAFNVDNVYADMRFQQGQNYTETSRASLEEYIVGTSFYLDAVRMEPGQDFYYLNLGRSLMSIVEIRRQSGGDLGQPLSDVRVEELLRLSSPDAVQTFVTQQPPLALMSYAEAVLLRAHQLSPLNKDHFANLARMYNFWYTRLGRDPTNLAKAIDWYQRGVAVAPQDVTILNEYASAMALQGNDAKQRGDQAAAEAAFAKAAELFARSKQIDPRYADTDARETEFLRLRGDYAAAVERYVDLLKTNPRALDAQITGIVESLRDQPQLLGQLRDAYALAATQQPDNIANFALVGLISARMDDLPRAAEAFTEVVQLEPENIEARQNYTLVLSDSQQYSQAAAQAEILLNLAQQQGANDQELAALQGLLIFLQHKVAGQ